MPVLEWLFPAGVILAGYVVLGITGFGSALVVVPLLAQKWALSEVVALAILVDIPASALHGGLNFAQVRWRELARLIPGMALGTGLGLGLMGQVDTRWLLLALGIYVVVVGLRGLLPQAPGAHASPHRAHLAGLLLGLVEVMFATTGPAGHCAGGDGARRRRGSGGTGHHWANRHGPAATALGPGPAPGRCWRIPGKPTGRTHSATLDEALHGRPAGSGGHCPHRSRLGVKGPRRGLKLRTPAGSIRVIHWPPA